MKLFLFGSLGTISTPWRT